jgi:BirA family biotin operon repressor/biotin-[acetyl-CoA-carboxylase] ligase
MNKIGSVHIHFKEITSTNDHLMNLLSKTNPPSGTVISADYQHSGRGQYGRSWVGEKGQNIAMSVLLLTTDLKIDEQFYINKAIALAICKWLKNILPQKNITIKWPNDIYIDDDKVCGILIQNIIQGAYYKAAIVGIGINIFQKTWPASILNPTSVALHRELKSGIQDLLPQIFNHINDWLEKLMCQQKAFIDISFDSCLWSIDKKVALLTSKGERIEGKLIGVSEVGKLKIIVDNHLIQYSHGEAQILIPKI